MTREEIREELENHIAACLRLSRLDDSIADSLSKSSMVLLDGLGVVIKVDRELPQHLMEGQIACDKATYQEMLRRAGIVAVKSLIKE